MNENREYKSDVFSMLMENKSYALQVYNALNGSSYDDPEAIEIVTLENDISISVRNDASFIVNADVSFYEHQSSYNPNMTVRFLIYYTSTLQTLLKNRDLYSMHPIMIPVPHFAVFYNGVSDRPAIETIKLSSSYEKPTDEPELELTCTIYNINPDKGKELLSRCAVLDEYTQFVETVRQFKADGIDEPIRNSIIYCIKHHILESFLRERGAEVIKNMGIDMTFERREGLIREEERNLGREEERANTERERKRAEAAEKELAELKKSMSIDMSFERREGLIREEERNLGREEERANTERALAEAERERKRAEAAEKRVAELEALLNRESV
ncbi:MAG: hypothetical protein IJS12_07620 [Lachnospiraceae bacterium]|nr:hypothetical protein [Lachnospiraceae bacterium]